MAKHLTTFEESRREAVAALGTLALTALLPKPLLSATSSDKPTHFIGLGGGGMRCLNFLHEAGIEGNYTCINWAKARPHLAREIAHIVYEPLIKKRYSYYQADADWLTYVRQKSPIPEAGIRLLERDEHFVLLSGLGGHTGTYLTETFVALLHKSQKSFLCITTLPFRFADENTRLFSQQSVEKLRGVPNFHYFGMDKIRELYGNLTLAKAYKKADEMMMQLYLANRPA